MRNTNSISEPTKGKEKTYSQEEIDLIDEKYKEKEKKIKKSIYEPANPVLDQYRQNLLQQPIFEKETIVYDTNTGKWILVKEPKK